MSDNDRAAITKAEKSSCWPNELSKFLIVFVDTRIYQHNVFCLILETIQ